MTDQTPPPPFAPAPAPASRPNGIWKLILGIVLALIGLFNALRGIIGFIATITQPDMVGPGVPLGVFTFGAALIVAAIFLFRSYVRNSAANHAARSGAVPPPAA